ncbi:unnamed protein product, partial [Adineta ricciae]
MALGKALGRFNVNVLPLLKFVTDRVLKVLNSCKDLVKYVKLNGFNKDIQSAGGFSLCQSNLTVFNKENDDPDNMSAKRKESDDDQDDIEVGESDGLNAIQIYDELVTAYGPDVVSYRTVARWVQRFSTEQQSLEDNPRSGRPVTVITQQNIDSVKDLVN